MWRWPRLKYIQLEKMRENGQAEIFIDGDQDCFPLANAREVVIELICPLKIVRFLGSTSTSSYCQTARLEVKIW